MSTITQRMERLPDRISPHLPVGTVLFGQPWNEDTGTAVLRDVNGNRVTFEETYLGDESGDAADVVAVRVN